MNVTQSLDRDKLDQYRKEFTRFRMAYKFALDEVTTKINILKEEFEFIHDYNPIEHVSSRLKSLESIIKKVMKKKISPSFQSIKENIKDIAGIRIICSFRSDIYKISDMIQSQKDVEVIEVKDYIKNPKSNGYQSMHLIIKVPVFMSDREEHTCVEVQIRTIAMDFWASLEHKIYYKYNKEIPESLLNQLKEAAKSASQLDKKMERLHEEVKVLKEKDHSEDIWDSLQDDYPTKLPEILTLLSHNQIDQK
ncbi:MULTISPECIES: GTP pyrophosphokinase [Bacillus]|uniref:GTP pyrophosphokinase n=1 Tax=Bacillus TaxID=1386 RepID=UPI0002F7CED2|nr:MULTISPECIES: GTP pyrophosphokinase family protein [Bacillus]